MNATTHPKRRPMLSVVIGVLALVGSLLTSPDAAHAVDGPGISGVVTVEGGGGVSAGQFMISARLINDPSGTDYGTVPVGADGSYVISGLAPGVYTARAVAVDATTYPPASSGTVALGTESPILAASEIRMRPFRTLAGKVVLPSGSYVPAGQAVVSIVEAGTTIASTTVAEGGQFSFSGLHPLSSLTIAADYLGTAAALDYNGSVGILANGPPAERIIRLGYSHSVSGTVRLESGDAAVGARVQLRTAGSITALATTTTGVDGTYAFVGLASGFYNIAVDALNAGSHDPEYQYTVGGPFQLTGGANLTDIDAVLVQSTEILGTVTRYEAPASSASVTLYRYDPSSDTETYVSSDYTDHLGRYSFDLLEAGTYTLRFAASWDSPVEYWDDTSVYYQPTAIVLEHGERFVADADIEPGYAFGGQVYGAGFTEADYAATKVEVLVFDYETGEWVGTGDLREVTSSGGWYVPYLYADYYVFAAWYDGPRGTAVDYSPVMEGTVWSQPRWDFYLEPSGSTASGVARIQQLHASLGGDEGYLGPAISGIQVFGVGVGQTFAFGSIFSHPVHGTWAVFNGPVRDEYLARGAVNGDLGWPVGKQTCISGLCAQQFQNGWILPSQIAILHAQLGGDEGTLGPAAGPVEKYAGGTAQRFRNGSIFSHPTYGTWAVMNGPIRNEYIARGLMNGPLGWPTGAQICSAGTCTQQFSGGTLPIPTIAQRHAALGGNAGALGPAQGAVENFPGGSGQRFLNGSIFSSVSGTWAVMNGPIRNEYIARGLMNGPLGWPKAEQVCTGDVCTQQFVGGSLPGPIGRLHANMGGNSGSLGPAQGGIETYGVGTAQRFLNGSIFSHPTHGTWAVMNGPIRSEYIARGLMNGPLGWPKAAQVCTGGVCSQQFSGGTIPGPIGQLHATMGGNTGALGPAQGGIETYGVGTAQRFLNGSIFSHPTHGTWAVMNGPIRNEYIARGLMNGSLGWPKAAEVCTGGVCTQVFSGGSLPGPIGQLHISLGGNAGALGPAQGGVESFPGGSAQRFLNGSVFSHPVHGTWAVMNGPIRNEYIARGLMNGVGWPTAAQVCTSGVCTQQFSGGILPLKTIAQRHTELGGNGGALGPAQAGIESFPGGTGQRFLNGSIFSSGRGTWEVMNGPIRNAYIAAGLMNGRFGWPIAAPVCSGGNCSQQFSGGTITG